MIEDTTKKSTRVLTHCCQVRNYSFCIKKCGADGCKICQPVSLQLDAFSKLRFLPDLMINPSRLLKQCKTRHQKKIVHLYKDRRKTQCAKTQSNRLTAKMVTRNISSLYKQKLSVQHVKNVNVMAQCEDYLYFQREN